MGLRASRKEKEEILQRLTSFNKESLDQPLPSGRTLLHLLIDEGRVDDVRELLSLGANVNTPDAVGDTPIMLALLHDTKSDDIVNLLLDSPELDLTVRHRAGWSCVMTAVISRRSQALRRLLELGAPMNRNPNHWSKSASTPLIAAVVNDDNESLSELLRYSTKMQLDDVDNWGHTVLERAASKGNLAAVKMLIQHGADLDLAAPLIAAVLGGFTGVVQHLFDAGADVNVSAPRGSQAPPSPLLAAICANAVSSFELLLQGGAAVNALHAVDLGLVDALSLSLVGSERGGLCTNFRSQYSSRALSKQRHCFYKQLVQPMIISLLIELSTLLDAMYYAGRRRRLAEARLDEPAAV